MVVVVSVVLVAPARGARAGGLCAAGGGGAVGSGLRAWPHGQLQGRPGIEVPDLGPSVHAVPRGVFPRLEQEVDGCSGWIPPRLAVVTALRVRGELESSDDGGGVHSVIVVVWSSLTSTSSSGVRPAGGTATGDQTSRRSCHTVARVTFCNTVSLQRNAPPPSTIGLLRLVIELTAVGFGPGRDTREEGESTARLPAALAGSSQARDFSQAAALAGDALESQASSTISASSWRLSSPIRLARRSTEACPSK